MPAKLSTEELLKAIKDAGGLAPAALLTAIELSGGLVGVNASAKALGVAPPNFKRYRPRLTEVPVGGSASVFAKREVDALADEMSEQRRTRGGES